MLVGWRELAEKVDSPIKMKRGWGSKGILDDEGCQDQEGIARITKIVFAFPNMCVILTRI